MINKPLVTVYITNHNYGRFIRQSIESVLNQTLQNIELLIIDDGSTDGSRKIIEEYRNHPSIHIIYQKHQGYIVANNIAVRIAHGKYIMRLDADDYLDKNALEKMSGLMEKDDTLGLVFPDYFYVDIEGEIVGKKRRHNFETEVSLYDQPAHPACTMIRLKFLRDLGGYNESLTCQDGYDLWLKFIAHHKVTNINQALFYYRRHNQNLTLDEERILTNRRKIKEIYMQSLTLKTPEVTAVIPVRSTLIDGKNWPIYQSNQKTVLENKVDELCKSSYVNHIVITTAEKDILAFSQDVFSNFDNVIILERPSEMARYHESLDRTYEHVLSELNRMQICPGILMSVSLEYPFATFDLFDDAVITLLLFKADSLLSVRPDTQTYYQHHGHGMVPILDHKKFTKLEREAIYKVAGGVVISTVENFKKNKRLISGKTSHVVVDEKTAFGVYSDMDFELYQLMQSPQSLGTFSK